MYACLFVLAVCSFALVCS